MQHYTFAVEAFIQMAKKFGMEEYEFAIHEAKTSEVIENVRLNRSEVGIIYKNEFNGKFIDKILKEHDLEFLPLFDCKIYVYLSKNNPLAKKEVIDFEDYNNTLVFPLNRGTIIPFILQKKCLAPMITGR